MYFSSLYPKREREREREREIERSWFNSHFIQIIYEMIVLISCDSSQVKPEPLDDDNEEFLPS